jgi:hypothetical protein
VVLVVDIYCCVWFCTHQTSEIGLFTVLLCVWSFASVTMLRVETVSQYHITCWCISSETESMMLALNFIVNTMKL